MRLLIIVHIWSAILIAQSDRPIAGRPFTLTYDPKPAGILTEAKSVSVVYAFDYWGTAAHQILRGESGSTDLFQNVLNPDPGRAQKVKMEKEGAIWKAEIQIPQGVRLLSWYFTGTMPMSFSCSGNEPRSDYNGKSTYRSYVYGENGKPVHGARFANVDFLFMEGKSASNVLHELENEVKEYPNNMLAHVVYWRFQYFATISPDTLKQLMKKSNTYFARFRKQLGDTVLNYQIQSLYDVHRIISLSLIGRVKDKDVGDLIKTLKGHISHAAELLPESKRTSKAKSVIAGVSDLSVEQFAKMYDDQKKNEVMLAGSVGQPAPDFTFTTTAGETYKLSDLKGKVVLLDFWGSWCGPCVGEIPYLKAAYDEFKNKGVIFISISNDAAPTKWTEKDLITYAENKGMFWLQVLDDPQTTIHRLYKIDFWPNPFLIGKDGRIITRQGLRGAELKKTLAGVL